MSGSVVKAVNSSTPLLGLSVVAHATRGVKVGAKGYKAYEEAAIKAENDIFSERRAWLRQDQDGSQRPAWFIE